MLTYDEKIRILMVDGCSKADAEKHCNMAIIYSDMEENLDVYLSECYDEDQAEELKQMVETKEAAEDWGIVELDGKTYYIQYVL